MILREIDNPNPIPEDFVVLNIKRDGRIAAMARNQSKGFYSCRNCRHGFNRVLDQVQNNLLELGRIACDLRNVFLEFRRKRYSVSMPRGTARSAAEKAGCAVGARKIERLQEREQAAEDIASRESQQGALRLDRILGEQKNRRNQIGKANERLNDRNENVNSPGGLNQSRYAVPEWRKSLQRRIGPDFTARGAIRSFHRNCPLGQCPRGQ